MPLSTRALCARIISAVVDRHRALDDAFASAPIAHLETRDRAFLQALAFASLRAGFRHSHLLQTLIAKAPHQDVRALLLVAMADIRILQTPAFAAVHAAVEAVRELGQPQAAGMVNAVLRRFVREQETLLASCPKATLLGLPSWLYQRINLQYPERLADWQSAHSEAAPMCLRLRPGVLAIEYCESLDPELAAHVVAALPQALLLKSTPTLNLPGFAEGRATIQDGSAQLAAHLLAAKSGERVLDACAAPGGKTAHLINLEPGISLTACDHDARRLELVASSLQRLAPNAINVRLLAQDGATAALAEPGWDAILLDAPCSATGVIRRHPDIVWLRRESDIEANVIEQARLLRACWQALRPGGRLLYATCSILAAENADQIGSFLNSHPDAEMQAWPEQHAWFGAQTEQKIGRQHFPGDHGMDGFYYALMRKRT
jgi:16S rRNA (cytosine967-C5)-methyltransferase